MKPVRLAGPLAALLLVAGCATPSGSTAFRVDGDDVSQRDVSTVVDGCSSLMGRKAAELRSPVAQFLLYGKLADAVAKRTGTAITPGMQAAAMKAVGGEQLKANPDCGRAADSFARYAALSAKLGKQRMTEQVRAVDVQLNPAYGTWDASTGQLNPTSGSLSQQDLGLGKVFG